MLEGRLSQGQEGSQEAQEEESQEKLDLGATMVSTEIAAHLTCPQDSHPSGFHHQIVIPIIYKSRLASLIIIINTKITMIIMIK